MKQVYTTLILVLALGIINSASGQVTKTWLPTNGGNWNTAANWNPIGVPTATDHVLIPADQSAVITRSGSTNGETINLKGITISGNVDFSFDPGFGSVLTLNVTGSLTIDAGKTFTVGVNNAGRIDFTLASTATGTINGTLFMNSSTLVDRAVTINGDLAISATGLVTGQNSPTFDLNPSGTLRIANAAGITSSGATGAVQVAGTRTFDVAAKYVYDGTANQNTGNGLPTNLTGSLTIDNPATVTLSSARNLGGTINLANGIFATGTNLTILNTGTPLINKTAGSITGTFQGTNDYDVTYTEATKATGIELANGGLRNVTVNLNAGQTLSLDANRSPDGTLTVSSGTFDISTFTINRSSTGGTLTVSNGAALRIGGTNTLPSSYSAHSIGASSTVEYAGAAQSVAALNSSQSYGNLILSGTGVKTFGGARNVVGTLSMQGVATATGTSPTYGASAILEYAGSATQTTANTEFPAASGPVNLKINNGNGVTLHAARTIAGVVTFANGILNTTSTNLLTIGAAGSTTGASDASFVNGPVKKQGAVGAGGFDFPVGKTGVGYMKIGIANVTGATTEFTAQYFRASATTTFGTAGLASLGLKGVSNCEYWTLDRTVTASAADVTLYWNAHSPCGGSYLSDPLFGIRIAHYNTSLSAWDAHGGNSPSGAAAAGSITWQGVTNFSPFALSALVGSQSSLPVLFNDVKAFEKNRGIEIDWSNLTERDLSNYVVERSLNGTDFTAIGQQLPRSNNNDKQSYSSFDAAPAAGANYYRVKAYEISGKIIYTRIVRVDIGKTAQSFAIYPNPVTGNQVSLSISYNQGQYTLKILNTAGQQVYGKKIIHQGGSMTQTIELPATMKPGVYNMVISGDNYRESKMFIVQ